MQKSENARKRQRQRINRKIKDDPRWAPIFAMYDLRSELAEKAGDYATVYHIQWLRQAFSTMIRKDYEREIGLNDSQKLR